MRLVSLFYICIDSGFYLPRIMLVFQLQKKKAKLGNSGILFQNLNLILGKSMKIAVLLLSSKQNKRNHSIQNYIKLYGPSLLQ